MKQINQLHNTQNVDVPHGLHSNIMKRVNHLKLRPLFFIILVLFISNLLVLASHINGKLVEAEFVDMLQDMTKDSYFDSLALGILIGRFFEIISFELIASVILNTVGAFYISSKLLPHTFNR